MLLYVIILYYFVCMYTIVYTVTMNQLGKNTHQCGNIWHDV